MLRFKGRMLSHADSERTFNIGIHFPCFALPNPTPATLLKAQVVSALDLSCLLPEPINLYYMCYIEMDANAI